MHASTTSFELHNLARSFKADPRAFLKNHPAETALLEYKASFALDTALSLCPLTDRQKSNALLNPEITLNIFTTLVAFANKQGGMLVLGVGETGRGIVSERLKKACSMGRQADGNGKLPCFMAHCNLLGAAEQALQIVGLESELAYRGMDFDEFQRHIQGLFTTNTSKPAVKFKPAAYPCTDKSVARTIKVVPSEALDPHIREITGVEVMSDTDSSYLLGLITVEAAPRPIYLTIDSSDSKNRLHVLPMRKTGQTELEEDLRRIETYISGHYEAKIAKRIAEEMISLTAAAKPTPVTPEYLSSLAADNASRWQAEGWANTLVETFGKDLCSYTTQSGFWEQENRSEVKALLLMVSLHYNSGWEVWTPRNAGNHAAVKALFMALHVRQWWRTRFRVLYALQFMDSQQVREELNDPCHANLSGETLKAIRSHVPHKTVVGFIGSLAEADLGDVSKKARQVLMEIATLWKDPKAGVDSPL